MRKLSPLALAVAGSFFVSPFVFAAEEMAKEQQKNEKILTLLQPTPLAKVTAHFLTECVPKSPGFSFLKSGAENSTLIRF